MIPDEEDVYVFYGIIGDGEDHYVTLETEVTVREMPFLWPSESYMLVPSIRH